MIFGTWLDGKTKIDYFLTSYNTEYLVQEFFL